MRKSCLMKRIAACAIVLALLLPGCSSRTKQSESSPRFSRNIPSSETKEEKLETPSPEDFFYHAEKTILTIPDVSENASCGHLQYSYADKPIITEHYIVVHANQYYGWNQLGYVDSSTLVSGDWYEANRWVVFDLAGNYLCDLPITNAQINPLFDEDEQGNIVALYALYDESDEYDCVMVQAAKYATSGAVLMEPHPIYAEKEDALTGLHMGKNDEIVFATPSQLVCANLDGTIHSTCTFPENHYCIGVWQKDNVIHTLVVPVTMEESAYDFEPSQEKMPMPTDPDMSSSTSLLFSLSITEKGMICSIEAGKEANNLLTMHIGQSNDGFCAATKNAIGTIDFETGEFCSLMDWNQTDADRNLVINGRFRVASAGVTDHPLNMLYPTDTVFSGMSIQVVEKSFTEIMDAAEENVDWQILPTESDEPISEEPSESSATISEATTTESITESVETVAASQEGSSSEDSAPAGTETTSVVPSESENPVTHIYVATTEETDNGNRPVLLSLVPMEENPHQNQNVIWMGGVHLADSPVATAINRYNADPSHSTWVKLHEYTDYTCNDDYGSWFFVGGIGNLVNSFYVTDNNAEAMTRMIEQVSAGNGPDIIYGAGEVGSLDRRGYLTDLRPYMDGKNGVNYDDYFWSAFDAFEVDGQLYQIPLSFRLIGMLQHNSIMETQPVQTFGDVLSLQNTDEQSLVPDYSTESILELLASGEMNSWMNFDAQTLCVHTDDLVKFLKIAEQLSHISGENQLYPAAAWFFNEEHHLGSMLFEESALLCPVEIGSSEEYCRIDARMPDYTWTGLPGRSADLTSIRSSSTVGIASYSTQKENAWEVIQYLLSADAQKLIRTPASISKGEESATFPVLRSIFYQDYFRMLDANSYEHNEGAYYFIYPVGPDTEPMLEHLLSCAHNRYVYDGDILYILLDECNKCIMGEVTYEEGAAEIIERINQLDDN